MPNAEELFRGIYRELGELNAKMDNLQEIRYTANDAKETAEKAMSSTKSAHLRIDDNEERIKSIQSNISWVVRTVLGVVILAVLGLVIVNS